MYIEKKITISKPSNQKGENGYKVIEVNVSNPADNTYAVCTPIKKQ